MAAVLTVFLLPACTLIRPINPPRGLKIGERTTESIALSWDAMDEALSYRVYYSLSSPVMPWGSAHGEQGSDSSVESVLRARAATPTGSETEETSMVVEGLEFDTGYYFIVVGVNLGGQSPPSVEESAFTLGIAPPAPANLHGTSPDAGTVLLSWDPIPDVGSWAIEYQVVGSTSVFATSMHTTSIEIERLYSGSTYSFRVAGFLRRTQGPWSEVEVYVY